MHKLAIAGVIGALVAGAAFAQIEASASVFFLDVDPARYAGPAGQRFAVRLGDEPRHVRLSDQDEICVQLQRSAPDGQVISARVRALRPEPHDAVVIKVAGPDISPGTFRSTPWGMLLRVVPNVNAASELGKASEMATDAPVCTL
jgi:hypothetical protein